MSLDTEQLHELVPLAQTLGIRLSRAQPDEVRLEMDWREDLCTAGALCAYLNLPAESGTTTIESKTNLLAAVRSGAVTAATTPLHVGSRLIVVETELRSEDRLVAKTLQTQAVLRG